MSLFIPMFIYAFSMGITPGPNNMIALSTGVNYGFLRTIPFTLGVMVGFNALLATIGFGVGGIIARNPDVMLVLSYAGTAFIIYMGYKIIMAPTELNTDADKTPGFVHGALLQLVNPKAWTACLGGIAAFNIAGNTFGILMYIGISIFVVLFCVGIWGYAGSKITHFLENQRNHKIFNVVMGGSLIVLAIYLLIMDQ